MLTHKSISALFAWEPVSPRLTRALTSISAFRDAIISAGICALLKLLTKSGPVKRVRAEVSCTKILVYQNQGFLKRIFYQQ